MAAFESLTAEFDGSTWNASSTSNIDTTAEVTIGVDKSEIVVTISPSYTNNIVFPFMYYPHESDSETGIGAFFTNISNSGFTIKLNKESMDDIQSGHQIQLEFTESSGLT